MQTYATMKTKELHIIIFLAALFACFPSTAQKSNATIPPVVTPLSRPYKIQSGLQGRNIALWNSHGLYYNQIEGQWRWQRARLLGTVEDLYTSDYVLSYLLPMLENAGANVFLPRERDINPIELIIDNDSHSKAYSETGTWTTGSQKGFAFLHESYTDGMNPFTDGSYRRTKAVKGAASATARWDIKIPESGRYAVYVAYHSEKGSATDARYAVRHAGGESLFAVNQSMGSGTWIYLGSFDFVPDGDNCIMLSNLSEHPGAIITADAVKVGGGMGNIARKPCFNPRKATKEALNNQIAQKKKEARQKNRKKKKAAPQKAAHVHAAQVSGFPRFAEAARYWMQWAGVPDTIYSDTGGDNDYFDDLRGRGYWVNYLCGGSRILPDSIGLGIPIDIALALHSDAGNEPGDSIVGTLGIYYTGRGKKELRYANRILRTQSQELGKCVLEQIANDIRLNLQPHWTMREDRNKRYAEARIAQVPTLLLESMSHQNFADMRYGHDPRFKFIFCRAVYKGILRYLSQRSGVPCIVQPLPVSHMALRWEGIDRVELSWKAVADSLEPTARPTCYRVYTRTGNHGWDNGVLTDETHYSRPLQPDVTYSFYVTAVNDGGESFPSETLSARKVSGADETVMIVNAFNRISAPAAFEDSTRTYAGFRFDNDYGVPYRHTIAYTGEQYEYNRLVPWVSDDDPGFGASRNDYEGTTVAGNSFDYPALHGESIARLGYSFLSASSQAVADGIVRLDYYPYADLIFGKQRSVMFGNDSARYDFQCFTPELMAALTGYCHSGGRLLISGAHIGQDLWEGIAASDESRSFATRTLHFRWVAARPAHNDASVRSIVPGYKHRTCRWNSRPNENCYAVEQTDILLPEGQGTATFMLYGDHSSAAVAYDNGIYKCCTLGFPIEAITEASQRNQIMKEIFQFLNRK